MNQNKNIPESAYGPKKTFVLDTCVLLHTEDCIFKFQEHNIVIPLMVIRELEKHKKGPTGLAKTARHALKNIRSLKRPDRRLCDGVPVGKNGGTLTVLPVDPKIKPGDSNSPDDKIIGVAKNLMQQEEEKYNNGKRPSKVILVTKDTAADIIAEAQRVPCEDYKNDKTYVYQNYGYIITPDRPNINGIRSNQYMFDGQNLYRKSGDRDFQQVPKRTNIYGITPRNPAQWAFMDAMLCPHIKVIAATGAPGGGKTLLPTAVGMYYIDRKASHAEGRSSGIKRMTVGRPAAETKMGDGKGMGFLPGDLHEKLDNYMQPIYDNLNLLIGTDRCVKDGKDRTYSSVHYLIDNGFVEIQSLDHIRGRTIANSLFLIDECQNTRPKDMVTIISRFGDNAKFVFVGDLDQIDIPYLDKASCGLSHIIARCIQQEDFCYIHLPKGERSDVASRYTALLQDQPVFEESQEEGDRLEYDMSHMK